MKKKRPDAAAPAHNAEPHERDKPDTERRDAELEAFTEAAERFLAACFPRSDTAALVVEPGDGIPPVVIPLMRGAIPSCIDCASWMRFSGHYTARGC